MYAKGTIVLIPFPFTDLSGHKVRPAVVLSATRGRGDMVVIFITSLPKSKPQQVLIQPSKANGLKVASGIMCDKIATLDSKMSIGVLGKVEAVTMTRVDDELRAVLGI